MSNVVISKDEYKRLCHLLEAAAGITLGESKHYLVNSRLNRLIQELGFSGYAELVDRMEDTGAFSLNEKVIDAMTTNETMWFRDIYPYEILKTKLLPELANSAGSRVRIWSSACSSGQEPYSISIAVQEYLVANRGRFPKEIEIVATDISPSMMSYAKKGIFDNSAMARGLSRERKEKYFKPQENGWEIDSNIKERVSFQMLNLKSSYSSLGKFDIVFCRNVLIYFSAELKSDILDRIANQLNPSGYLILGSSEAPNRYSSRFAMTKTPKGVVYRYI